MTLRRRGWIGQRPFAEVIDPDTLKPSLWICLICRGELPADAHAFESHDCLNYQERKKPRRKKTARKEEAAPVEEVVEEAEESATGITVEFASEVARRLAEEAGLSDPDFEERQPSSMFGFSAADVRRILTDWEGETDDADGEEDDEEREDATGSIGLEDHDPID